MKNKIIIKTVQNHLSEDILDVSQILNRGEVNEIYILSTKSSKYILRLDPNENSLDRFQKEAWCMEEVFKKGVLVPRVHHLGMVQKYPYIILSFIEGINGDESNEKTGLTWSRLGEYARKIHSIPIEGYGERMVSPGIFDGKWQQFLSYNISSLSPDDKLRELGVITSAQSQKLRNIFEDIKITNFVFGLIHFDLSLNNTIITDDGGVYLLDWGSAEVNVVPHMDIEEILESSLQDDSDEFELFLRGYGLVKADYKKIKPKIEKLSLLTKIDKLRWAIDRKPERIEYHKSIVKNKLIKLDI